MLLLLISLIFLILLSAFFSSSETALMSINRYRLRHQARQGHKGALRTLKLLKKPDCLLSVILTGNTLANVLASILATVLIIENFGEQMVFIGSLILTLTILVFAEIIPKTLAACYSKQWSFIVALPLQLLLVLCKPVVWLSNTVTHFVLKSCKLTLPHSGDDALNSEELRSVIREAGDKKLSPQYTNMLLNLLDLEKTTVNDIMVTQAKINSADLDDSWQSIQYKIISSPYSQLIIYQHDWNHVRGILPIREALRLLAEKQLNPKSMIDLLKPINFTPEETPLYTQLIEFQRNKTRVSLVVNEYGDIQGLITLDSILSEITHEFEPANTQQVNKHKLCQPLGNNTYLIDGSCSLHELNKLLPSALPNTEANTVNGLITDYLQFIPENPLCLQINNYRIEILRITEHQIQQIKLLSIK